MVQCQMKRCRNETCRALVKKSMFMIPNPKNERSRCLKWLCILGRDDNPKFKIETFEYGRNNVVCEDHFKPDCFEEDLRARLMGCRPRKKLKPDAIPTIPTDQVDPPTKQAIAKTGKRNSRKSHSSTSKSHPTTRKKQKLVTSENANDEHFSGDIKEETSFEELFIPPLFPSRLPLNEEEEEDEDEPEFELKSDEDSHVHPTGGNLSTESNLQLSTLLEQEHDIGPYCNQEGINKADITSDFQNVSLLPTIKNGLVLEIYDHLHTMQIYSSSFLVATLKRLNDCPQANDRSVGSFIHKLVERRDRIQPKTKKGEKDLRLLYEEKFMLIRKRTVTKRRETPREKALNKTLQLVRKNLVLAKKQRAETWKCLDQLEKDMRRSRQENAALSKKVTELSTENKDLRSTVFSLVEQLQQFKR